ncbi:MAG: hypothetical protein ACTSUB_00350 [Candidatus Thorarchaeota archaeon]
MTCYFRHMKVIFDEIGVEVSTDNKRELDQRIHKLLNIDYKDCSSTWKEIKKQLADDRPSFITALEKTLLYNPPRS